MPAFHCRVPNAQLQIVSTIFATVVAMEMVPWEDVEKLLNEHHHSLLVVLNSAWETC